MNLFSKYNNTDKILELYTTSIFISCDERFKLRETHTFFFLVIFVRNNLSFIIGSKTIPTHLENK